MIVAIQGFGVLIALVGLVILVNPMMIFGFLGKHLERTELRVSAVVVRIVLGLLLFVTAGQSRYPLVMEWLGGLSIAAALILAFMGRGRFVRIMRWAMGLVDRFGRLSGLAALAFGGFLIFAYT